MVSDLEKRKNIATSVFDTLDKPIDPSIYPVIDTDLARDNLENDLPAADLEDLSATDMKRLFIKQ